MNKQELYRKMEEKNISITEMFQALGMSRSAFYRKCNGKSEFTLGEISRIMQILGIDDANAIFFSERVS